MMICLTFVIDIRFYLYIGIRSNKLIRSYNLRNHQGENIKIFYILCFRIWTRDKTNNIFKVFSEKHIRLYKNNTTKLYCIMQSGKLVNFK